MKTLKAKHICSQTDWTKCPPPVKPEYAFIGRSNVGKSSLINMLCGQSHLANVSSMPGKTRVINHFLIDEKWFMVDLPGYGWAKVSKSKREEFQKMIDDYLLNRPNLLTTFVLIDIRHEPQDNDIDFMTELGLRQIPFAMVFTKADKLSPTAAQKSVETYLKYMSTAWEESPPYFITSAEKKAGREDVLKYIESLHVYFKPVYHKNHNHSQKP
ncbi:MAG: YihA family ribosome biogenesis GTP-binding protein [Cytophagales bacterium]|nr:MAG: YihA family ribosome biogenesis GTP-binding protein [Cytophagales bacterium]TAF59887.1 MAG: YihA family ribosome biogenesis GTP-binding protein [Cytophagales bacterium]